MPVFSGRATGGSYPFMTYSSQRPQGRVETQDPEGQAASELMALFGLLALCVLLLSVDPCEPTPFHFYVTFNYPFCLYRYPNFHHFIPLKRDKTAQTAAPSSDRPAPPPQPWEQNHGTHTTEHTVPDKPRIKHQ